MYFLYLFLSILLCITIVIICKTATLLQKQRNELQIYHQTRTEKRRFCHLITLLCVISVYLKVTQVQDHDV